MKHINKFLSPTAFEDWKVNWRAKNGTSLNDLYEQEDMTGKKLWGVLRTSKHPDSLYSKEELKNALLTEQGYICCYCNRELLYKTTTLEHFWSKGTKEYFNLAYDYTNLFVSCDGFAKEPKPRYVCCNEKRLEGDLLPLNPTESLIETHFDFTIDGQIIGLTTNGKEMIALLGLDIYQLDNLRAAYYIKDALYENPFEDTKTLISKKEALEVIEKLKVRQNEQFEPFCTAVIKVLQNEIINKTEET